MSLPKNLKNISPFFLKNCSNRLLSIPPLPSHIFPYLIICVCSTAALSQSLETISAPPTLQITREDLLRGFNPKQSTQDQEPRNVLMPCGNGQSYSVSQNQIVHLPGPDAPSVKHRVSKLETQGQRRRGLVLNLTNQFEAATSKPSSPESDSDPPPKPLNSPPPNDRTHLDNGVTTKRTRNDNSDSLVWTASAESKCTNATINDRKTSVDGVPPRTRRLKTTGDPFSAQLDRVFDREERRGEPLRESPSRQSSWSSYDSAVVLDNNSVHSSWATLPSRNSSWGSYDMRPSDPLGSSGLFPYDKEEIPWHPGTVKRTKQKLEEGTGTIKRVCTQSEDVYNPVLLHYTPSPTPRRRDSSPIADDSNRTAIKPAASSSPAGIDISPVSVTRQLSRLSTSAPAPSSLSPDTDNLTSTLLRTCRSESETSSPCVVNTTQCPSVKHHKMVLENLSKPNFTKRCLSADDSPEQNSSSSSSSSSESSRNVSGIVKSLKKEFEAKSTKFERSPENNGERESKVIRSLPSSPVIAHSEVKIRGEIGGSTENEDLSVRVLVGKYEKPDSRRNSEIVVRSQMEAHPPARSKIATQEFARRSAPIMIHSGPGIFISETQEAPGRPPVPTPSVVVASVVAKAASKKQQQHGRTHPLARLQVRPRHNSPVYNTM